MNLQILRSILVFSSCVIKTGANVTYVTYGVLKDCAAANSSSGIKGKIFVPEYDVVIQCQTFVENTASSCTCAYNVSQLLDRAGKCLFGVEKAFLAFQTDVTPYEQRCTYEEVAKSGFGNFTPGLDIVQCYNSVLDKNTADEVRVLRMEVKAHHATQHNATFQCVPHCTGNNYLNCVRIDTFPIQFSPNCTRGVFGPFCNLTCAYRCIDGVCNRENGSCSFTDCEKGTFGPWCNESCDKRCLGGTCGSDTGNCKLDPRACEPGKHGLGCNLPCDKRCLDVCNFVDGNCTIKDCEPGNYGKHCNLSCDARCNGFCHPLNGSCTLKDQSMFDAGRNSLLSVFVIVAILVGAIIASLFFFVKGNRRSEPAASGAKRRSDDKSNRDKELQAADRVESPDPGQEQLPGQASVVKEVQVRMKTQQTKSEIPGTEMNTTYAGENITSPAGLKLIESKRATGNLESGGLRTGVTGAGAQSATANNLNPKSETADKLNAKSETANKLNPNSSTPNILNPKSETANKLNPKSETANKLNPKSETANIPIPDLSTTESEYESCSGCGGEDSEID